jgi:hypothetical protein
VLTATRALELGAASARAMRLRILRDLASANDPVAYFAGLITALAGIACAELGVDRGAEVLRLAQDATAVVATRRPRVRR